MKQQQRSLITKGILILLSLVLLIFISTYAWFTSIPEPVSATGVSVKTQKSADFDVAVGFYSSDSDEYKVTDFTKEAISLSHLQIGDNEYSIYDNWAPKDLTSDGVDIIRPGLKNRNSEVKTEPYSFTDPTAGKEYIMFDFIFRSDSSQGIDLASGSFARALHESAVADGNLTPTEWGDTRDDKSKMGNFSVDAIVGSLRVSFNPYVFTDSDDLSTIKSDTPTKRTDTASCIWIPRPDLFLNSTKSSTGEDTFSLMTNVDSSHGTYVHKYWNKDGEEKTFPQNKTLIGSYNTNGAKSVSLSSDYSVDKCTVCTCSKQIEGKYYGKVRVYIWTEGEDSEARKALVGGQYYITMDLSQD